MKIRLNNIAIAIGLGLLLAACGKDPQPTPGGGSGEGEAGAVTIKIEVPSMGLPESKSEAEFPHEYLIESLDVFLFDKTTNGDQGALTSYLPIDLADITRDGNYYIFKVDPDDFPTEGIYDLMLLVNLRTEINEARTAGLFDIGDTKADVLYRISSIFDASNYMAGWMSLPMWGEIEVKFNDGIESTLIVTLLRAVCSIDVCLSEEAQTTIDLNNIWLFNPMYSMSIAPYPENYSRNFRKVTAPSLLPNGMQGPSTLEYVLPGETDLRGVFYVPEQSNSQPTDKRCRVVIGAKYQGGAAVTYYEVQLTDTRGNYVDFLRNHRYIITINAVLSQGAPTPAAALDHQTLHLLASVIPWTDGAEVETEIKGKP